MFRISVRPDRKGFWYLIEAPNGSSYVFEFLAIGTEGNILRDEIWDGLQRSGNLFLQTIPSFALE